MITSAHRRVRRYWSTVLLVAGCLAGLPAVAQELPGVKPGEPAPTFALKNQAGRTVQLPDLLARGPVAVVFYRSADW